MIIQITYYEVNENDLTLTLVFICKFNKLFIYILPFNFKLDWSYIYIFFIITFIH